MGLSIDMAANYTSSIISDRLFKVLTKASFDIKWATTAATKDGVIEIYAVTNENVESLIDTIPVTSASGDLNRWTEYPCYGFIIKYLHYTIDNGTMVVVSNLLTYE